MAFINLSSNSTSVGNKVDVQGSTLVLNGLLVSANNPLPVTGGTGGGSTGSSNNQIQGIANGIPQPVIESDIRSNTVNLTTTANSFVDIPLNGAALVGLRFTGLAAANAVVTYYSSNDTNPPTSPISSYNAATGVTSATRNTDGETRIAVSGRSILRLAVTTPGTGNVAISYNISTRQGIVDLASPIPGGNNFIGFTNLANTANINVINFPNNQVVSGNVAVVGNVSVTGIFYQNTQPVSIANTVPVSIANTISANIINFPATQVVSGNVSIVGNTSALVLNIVNTNIINTANVALVNNTVIISNTNVVKVRSSVSTIGTSSSMAGNTTATILLPSNANRISYRIYNESTAILYLLCATGTPSNTNYSLQIASGGYFTDDDYSGIIQGVWANSVGFARITELT